jgi:DNA-dependent RNA polymerase auxiliary subunit epsilon
MDHEWDVEYLEDIARVVLDYDHKTGHTSWPPGQTRRYAK